MGMSLEYRRVLLKIIDKLNVFIQKRKYCRTQDIIKLTFINPVGEEIEVCTVADAEDLKARLEQRLALEKLYSN